MPDDGHLQVYQPAPGEQLLPSYTLRGHSVQIAALRFSSCGRFLFSGDTDGLCARWSLITFRPQVFWRAHQAGLLAIEEWNDGLLSQGRDNKIKFWHLPQPTRAVARSSAHAVPGPAQLSQLDAVWEMDVNAMAYCRMSLLRLPEEQALMAAPALTKDDKIDIYHLPSQGRVHRSIGEGVFPINDKTGSVTALQLYESNSQIRLLAGYEDGRVGLFAFDGPRQDAVQPSNVLKDEGKGWSLLWDVKGHRDALMSLVLAPDRLTAWSVGADHFLCKYALVDERGDSESRLQKNATVSPGRSAMAVRDDDLLVAVAGWDGCGRLYSTQSGAPLAVLEYHRMALHAVAFAPLSKGHDASTQSNDSDDDDDVTPRRAFLALGGTDSRISLWEPFAPK